MDRWIQNKIVALRHELHKAAELSGKEVKTKGILMDFIKENTDFEVVDRGSWFYVHADMGPGRTMGIRADMDALPMDDSFTTEELPWRSETPGVSHKCGHDGHSACLAGLALMLWQDKEDNQGSCGESVCGDIDDMSQSAVQTGKLRSLPYGNIYMIFQHAEEIGAGGEACSRLIDEKGIREMYSFHNWSGFPEGSVKVSDSLSQCASQGLLIKYEGVRTHASEPEHGINPSETIAKLAIRVGKIANMSDYRALTMATIVGMNSGSLNFGMAAAEGYLALTLRASLDEDLKKLKERILEAAAELANTSVDASGRNNSVDDTERQNNERMEHLRLSIEEFDIFPATVNTKAGAERVRAAAAPVKVKRKTPEANTFIMNQCEIIPMDEPYRASEDFGWYLQKAEGAMFYIGNGEDYPPIHTDRYDFNDNIIPVVCDIFYNLCRG